MNLEQTKRKKVVSLCETQPLTVFGLENLLKGTEDLEFGSSHASPAGWLQTPNADRTDILMIDKGLGVKVVLDTLTQLPLGAWK